MNVFNKEVFFKRLKYDFPIYIISAVLLSLVWVFLFNFKMKPNPDKSINIFIPAFNINNNLEDDLINNFNEVEHFGLSFYDYEAEGFDEKLSVVGIIGSDIIILPKEKVQGLILERIALKLNEDFFSGEEFLKEDLISFGIKINESSKSNLGKSILLKDIEYYIFINNRVKNEEKLENIYNVIKFLLSY